MLNSTLGLANMSNLVVNRNSFNIGPLLVNGCDSINRYIQRFRA